MSRNVLLLNSSYEPIHVCSWKRAVVLMLKGKAVQVEAHEATTIGTVPEKHSSEGAGKHLPLVIRLVYYVKIPHKDIPLTRRNVMHRDNYTCQYCGRKSDLTIDHVLPRSRGGKDVWENVVVACLRCNVGKGSKTPQEANLTLPNKPARPFNFVHFELSKQRQGNVKEYLRWRKYLYEGLDY